MYSVKKTAQRLNGILSYLLLGALLAYSIPFLLNALKAQPEPVRDLASRQAPHEFERHHAHQPAGRDTAAQAWVRSDNALSARSTDAVVPGQGDWLFTQQEYLIPGDLADNLQEQITRILALRDTLRAHNKDLVLMPVPMKSDIYQTKTSTAPAPQAVALYDLFVELLDQREVAVVPLRHTFLEQRDRQPLFLRQDTHWTPEGARLAAQKVAFDRPDLRGNTAYSTQRVGTTSYRGDLLGSLQHTGNESVSETLSLYETLPAAEMTSAADLFEEPAFSIALVGSSYSRNELFNFSGFLKEALNSDLLTLAASDAHPLNAMQSFVDGPLLDDPSITTVIWEYPLRTLLTPRRSAHAPAAPQTFRF